MKRSIIMIIGFLFLVSCLAIAEEEKKYGEGVTLKKATEISTILANPEDFVGKKVLVKGTVVGVCAHKGCWIDVAGTKEFEKIKIKVNDGEIVFPLTAKGKTIFAEGIVEAIQTDAPKIAEKEMHKEHKEGETCENCAGESKDANVVYRIKGLGAVIK